MADACYFLQTHRDPAQIHRLVGALRRGSPRSTIIVQHNFAGCALEREPLERIGGVHLLEVDYRQVRGNWSCQVQPTLDAVEWVDARGIDYDWLITLTGQDYPVAPLAAGERRLRESGADAFLRHWDVLGPTSPWPRHKPVRRYWYRYSRCEGVPPRALRLLRRLAHLVPGVHVSLHYGPFVGVRALRTPWHGGFRCYGGWAWGALRREAAREVVRFLHERPEVTALYRRTMTPEESVLQTVLCNSGRFRLVDDDLRYIDYTGSTTGSPRTITCADLPTFASGRYSFARKFDPTVDAAVLDRLDERLAAAGP